MFPNFILGFWVFLGNCTPFFTGINNAIFLFKGLLGLVDIQKN